MDQTGPYFAQDESSASTEELLNSLRSEEMKKLGVEMKIPMNNTSVGHSDRICIHYTVDLNH
jgi:hypothetical protein